MMWMRKLNISNYVVVGVDRESNIVKIPYNVRRSIEAIVLATGEVTNQRLNMADLMRAAQVTQKIVSCEKDTILLEEHEFQIIEKAFRAFRGFGRNEVEMCKRIVEAETVEVKEVSEEKSG